jgi:uracil-DNA glycosylase
VDALVRTTFGTAFNFYRHGNGAGLRRERLREYLERRSEARLLLVGEAAGYRGARVSGIPFTSERQLSGAGPAEATATIVHRVLAELGIENDALLWNVLPAHPHRPGRPASNRPPTRREVAAGRPFVEALAEGRTVVPIGRVAGAALGLPCIRHPSHGGATAFRDGLSALVRLPGPAATLAEWRTVCPPSVMHAPRKGRNRDGNDCRGHEDLERETA